MTALVVGCYQPEVPADRLSADADGPPSSDFVAGAGGMEVPTCPDRAPSTLSELAVSVRTSPVGGQFAPRNVGAIWVEDAGGTFVKTLERWGTTRAKWLVTFNEASGGDVVDAITGATKKVHDTHEVRWDLADVEGCEVPAGDYHLWLELTDRSGEGAHHDVPFAKGNGGFVLMPDDAPQFHEIVLELR